VNKQAILMKSVAVSWH